MTKLTLIIQNFVCIVDTEYIWTWAATK